MESAQGPVKDGALAAIRDAAPPTLQVGMHALPGVDAVLLLGVDDSDKIWVNGSRVFRAAHGPRAHGRPGSRAGSPRGRNQQNRAQALPEHPGLGVLCADRHCQWPASAVQAKKRMTHRVWSLCKLILQRWIGAPDFPSEWAGTGLTSLKRKRRAFENASYSMPFACASGLLQAISPASYAFSTAIDPAL